MPDKRDLVVLITGAAGGLGRALARSYCRAGARLVLTDLSQEGLDQLEAELSGENLLLAGDVTKEQDCALIIQAAEKKFGRLDLLINNAGLSHRSLFTGTPILVIRRIMDVNFFGAVNMTRAAIPALEKTRGRVAAVSSVAGFAPLYGRTGLCGQQICAPWFF